MTSNEFPSMSLSRPLPRSKGDTSLGQETGGIAGSLLTDCVRCYVLGIFTGSIPISVSGSLRGMHGTEQIHCQRSWAGNNHYNLYRDCSIFPAPVNWLSSLLHSCSYLHRICPGTTGPGGEPLPISCIGVALMTLILHGIANPCNGYNVTCKLGYSDSGSNPLVSVWELNLGSKLREGKPPDQLCLHTGCRVVL